MAELLIGCLDGILSPDVTQRNLAERKLAELETTEEYGMNLTEIILSDRAPFAARQLACVLLKQYVQRHWSPDSDKFVPPETSAKVKESIRGSLPLSLRERISRIRTGGAYAISAIAKFDWPRHWPNLFDIIADAISSGDTDLVHGGMRVVMEFVNNITDEQMEYMGPILLRELLNIFVQDQVFAVRTRTRTVAIFCTLSRLISAMGRTDKMAPKRLLFLQLPQYAQAYTAELEAPDSPSSDIALKAEIIKTLVFLINNFPKHMQRFLPRIFAAVWTLLKQSTELYSQMISGEPNDETSVDSDGEVFGLEKLISALLDAIQTLTGQKKLASDITGVMPELLQLLLIYMQIPEDKVEEWLKNVERYLESEDEETAVFTVRTASVDLLLALSDAFPNDCISALCVAVTNLMFRTVQQRQMEDSSWWKIRECCYTAMGSVASRLATVIRQGSSFDMNGFISTYLLPDLDCTEHIFLQGHALWFAGRIASVWPEELLQKLLTLCTAALAPQQNIVMRVCSCRAFYHFCDYINEQHLNASSLCDLKVIISHLVQLGIRSNETVLNLVFSSLLLCIKVDPAAAAACERKIIPFSTAAMLKFNGDPLIPTHVAEVVRAMVSFPSCRTPIEKNLLLTIIGILKSDNKAKLPIRLQAACLEVMEGLIRGCGQPLCDVLVNEGFPAVAHCILSSDDSHTLQAGRECVRAFVSKGAQQILDWKSDDSEDGASLLAKIILHLLHPSAPEFCAGMVGRLFYVLLKRADTAILPYVEQILRAVLYKLKICELNSVQQSLLMIFAHVIHFQLEATLNFLSSINEPDFTNAMQYFFEVWCSKQKLFFGAYDQKVSILALCKVFSYAVSSPNAILRQMTIQEDVINLVTTQSEESMESGQAKMVPLLVKIFKLLIFELHNLLETHSASATVCNDDNNDDSDEETAKSSSLRRDELVNALTAIVAGFQGGASSDADSSDSDDPDTTDDSISKIDLLSVLTDFLFKLSQQQYYLELCHHLTDEEREILQRLKLLC